jgi:hypothetical protein
MADNMDNMGCVTNSDNITAPKQAPAEKLNAIRSQSIMSPASSKSIGQEAKHRQSHQHHHHPDTTGPDMTHQASWSRPNAAKR